MFRDMRTWVQTNPVMSDSALPSFSCGNPQKLEHYKDYREEARSRAVYTKNKVLDICCLGFSGT